MSFRVNFAVFISSFVAVAALTSGCVIVGGTNNNNSGGSGGQGGAGVGGSGSSSSAGTGGQGQGGQGGGGGGAGVGGAGGSGGGCVKPEDGSSDALACDAMNITPTSAGGTAKSVCDDMGGTNGAFDPPGYGGCKHGFTVFTHGAANTLQDCLATIAGDPATACALKPVSDCFFEASIKACPSQISADTCDKIGTACSGAGQAFDPAACLIQLNPMLDAAIATLVDQFNNADPSLSCQDAFDQAYSNVVLTF